MCVTSFCREKKEKEQEAIAEYPAKTVFGVGLALNVDVEVGTIDDETDAAKDAVGDAEPDAAKDAVGDTEPDAVRDTVGETVREDEGEDVGDSEVVGEGVSDADAAVISGEAETLVEALGVNE